MIVRRMLVQRMFDRRCGPVGGQVDDDAVEVQVSSCAGDDHVDRVVRRARDSPQVGGGPVRRQRRFAHRQYAGGDPLLTGVGCARQAGDMRVDLVDRPCGGRPVPG
jgi:hypothetical protein